MLHGPGFTGPLFYNRMFCSAFLEATAGTASSSSSFFAWLLIVSMLFELAKQSTLLKLKVKALQSRINRLVWLNCYVNQNGFSSRADIMAQIF